MFLLSRSEHIHVVYMNKCECTSICVFCVCVWFFFTSELFMCYVNLIEIVFFRDVNDYSNYILLTKLTRYHIEPFKLWDFNQMVYLAEKYQLQLKIIHILKLLGSVFYTS